MEIVLFQPQIPQNTGNIVRTCAVTGTALTLVKPLGFNVTSRMLKRAGLDYWKNVQTKMIDNLIPYLNGKNFYFFSSKASKLYHTHKFGKSDLLIFGSETFGLPPIFFQKWPERFLTLPMRKGRCLNLSNAVAIALYEAWRQHHFVFDTK